MASLIERQAEIFEEIKKILTNIKKDSASRKTPEYVEKRLTQLNLLWSEYDLNNTELMKEEDKSHQYFIDEIFNVTISYCDAIREALAASQVKKQVAFNVDVETLKDLGGASGQSNSNHSTSNDRVAELKKAQYANFRALTRLVHIKIDSIQEKWEIEDRLKAMETRWNAIENLHLQIDGSLEGSDRNYYMMFDDQETCYAKVKKALNQKLNSTVHQQQSMPRLEIPTFSGNYTQWPTFMDLYNETIHNNSALTKAQKMQHLKGKLRGEAERLVQHMNITAENYDVCWEILTHRYDNKHLLFTKQFQLFMRQPNVQKQTASELKRLYDTTMEAIHAIHNLAVDTRSWDPMLVQILCEKLDTDTYTDYMEARANPRDLASFEEFMSFLESKFTALEPINRKKPEPIIVKQPQSPYRNPQFSNKHPRQHFNQHIKNSSFQRSNNAFHIGSFSYKIICPCCKNDHALYQCRLFLTMSPNDQLATITKLKICKNCLYVHTKDECTSEKRCKECKKAHNTLLHDAFSNAAEMKPPSDPKVPPSANPKRVQNNFVASNDDEILLPTALLQVLSTDGTYVTLRALLDQGSQITLITENAAQRLGLKREQFNANVSGVGTLSNKSRGKVFLQCKSLHTDFHFKTEALIMSCVVSNLPNTTLEKKAYEHTANITLADPEFNVSRPIDILLDADVYSQILMSGLVKGQEQQPMAQQTKLGWILSGTVKTYNCHVLTSESVDLSKYWEIEDIGEERDSLMTSQEQYCEDFYVKTTKRLENGRYEVRLPMKENYKQMLGKSKPIAIAQFNTLEKKLSKDKALSDSYVKFIEEYIAMGHMKESKADLFPSCYLPHHGVHKQDSTTTKLRVVYNASKKTSTGYSLNDLMECGPKLHQDLQELLIRWRLYPYVFTSDCEKMYRMLPVSEQDQQLQKIVWRDTPNGNGPLRYYQLTTVTYGTKAAPFLALRTLKQLAQDDADRYPLGADIINSEMYIDDVLSGGYTIQQAKQKQQDLNAIMQGAGFNLRKWTANDPKLIENIPNENLGMSTLDFKNAESTKALGLQWNPLEDSFSFKNKIDTSAKQNITKRVLLSEIAKIFDPLGWLTPVTVKAKLLFQNVWSLSCEWDQKLPENIQNEWQQFINDINNIEQFKIPRWLGNTSAFFEIHGFCDASEKAYACAIYVRTYDDKNDSVIRLIAAKSRLTPIKKKITLPRLELCGALLLANLMNKVLKACEWKNCGNSIYAWTDSMIVLGWLKGDVNKWKTFVSNRVKQIQDVIPKQQWNHVKSEENAVDCATRGMTSSQLLSHHLWWVGPTWLKSFEAKNTEQSNIITTDCELKHKQVNVTQAQPSSVVMELLDKHNNMNHSTRVLAWIMRFIRHLKTKGNHSRLKHNYLTSDELEHARQQFIRQVQHYELHDDIERLQKSNRLSTRSKILSLHPFLDKGSILRVGGRLNNSNLNDSAKNPIILPHNSRITELFIEQAHKQTLHGGPKLTLAHLRQKFWIIGGYRAVKRQIHKCVKCRRFNAQQQTQLMADLPPPRVNISSPFTHSGVDFSGYVDIKANKGRGIKTLKAYIAVFICLATKAVHLELVSDLSSTSFISAFRRFCARRGTPSDMYSDNGTNFVGANRILKKQYKEILDTIDSNLLNSIGEMGVKWHFNCPAFPSAGGLWEAAVKSMKYHMKRVLGEQKLTYEEFTTLLCQIEACLNSRPLCRLTENTEDLDCLTPGHFLTGKALLALPEPTSDERDLRQRWQMLQKMSKGFWNKWSGEYLQQLQARHKWQRPTQDPQIDDVVCIKDENTPAGRWPLGRIIEKHPGKDGHTRVVTLKTAHGITKRPIIKLVQLRNAEESINKQEHEENDNCIRPTRRHKTCNQNVNC